MKLTKKELLEKIKDDPENTVYEFKKIKGNKLRTYKQVRYYFGVLIKIVSNYTGYMPLELNEQNKLLFGKDTFIDLSTSEFETAMSGLRQFYHFHLGLNIPKPNEENFDYELKY